jgi:hypothetical protein
MRHQPTTDGIRRIVALMTGMDVAEAAKEIMTEEGNALVSGAQTGEVAQRDDAGLEYEMTSGMEVANIGKVHSRTLFVFGLEGIAMISLSTQAEDSSVTDSQVKKLFDSFSFDDRHAYDELVNEIASSLNPAIPQNTIRLEPITLVDQLTSPKVLGIVGCVAVLAFIFVRNIGIGKRESAKK